MTKTADSEKSTMNITLSNICHNPGSRKRNRRLGLGEGSGHGQTSTRGQKGQRSRSGDGKMPGFEGGQTPLLRRVPKRGFTNGAFKIVYQVVSLESIERIFKNKKEVTMEDLKMHGLVSGRKPIKVLGDGDIKTAYKISAHAFSKSAIAKIEKAGGKAESVARPSLAATAKA